MIAELNSLCAEEERENMNQDKIKMREKLSFAMANFGNIPIMTLINGYLLIFIPIYAA